MKRSVLALMVLVLLFVLAMDGSALAYKGHTAPDLKCSRLNASSSPGFWNITLSWNLHAGRPTYCLVAWEFGSGGWQSKEYRLNQRQVKAGKAVIGPFSAADLLSLQGGLANKWGTEWGPVLFLR